MKSVLTGFTVYTIVLWQGNLYVKLLFVVMASFCLTLGICEFLIRRIAPIGRLFGMKNTVRPAPTTVKEQVSFQ